MDEILVNSDDEIAKEIEVIKIQEIEEIAKRNTIYF